MTPFAEVGDHKIMAQQRGLYQKCETDQSRKDSSFLTYTFL